MPHVITQSCCNDAGCVAACPVNCIHPTPDEPEFATAEMLYIDPATCIDCGACIPECPVDAIAPDAELSGNRRRFLSINADYYTDHDVRAGLVPIRPRVTANRRETTRVAIVGAGPAGFYAAERLLREPNVRIDLIDRLPTPYGLVRAGVAPDHASTKKVTDTFASVAASPRFRYLLGVEVGRHVFPAELARAYTAVVYAHGASAVRSLGIPGEDHPGSVSSTEFVGWYNGHPDHADRRYDLSGERAVVIGNGNVALDVARVLLTDQAQLATTDIADHALQALRRSNIREVVVLARRGPAEAAYTVGELATMADIPGVDVVCEPTAIPDETATDSVTRAKILLLREFSTAPRSGGDRRVVFRFHTTPAALIGGADGVRAVETAGGERIPTGLVIRAIGYRGRPIEGIPFDHDRGIVPNEAGRIAGMPGRYVAGWIKRGSRGGIGANRVCGEQTALSIIEDLRAGSLDGRPAEHLDIRALAAERGATVIDLSGWNRIDTAESAAGSETGRERVKLTTIDALTQAAIA